MDTTSLQNRFCASYEAQSDNIFRFCAFRISNHEEALDLTQETFTRLWMNLAKGTRINNERAFLFTIAHHLVIDWYRKKKALSLESLMMESNSREKEMEPSDKKTCSDLETESEGRYFLDKVEELGESYRRAVYLRFVEGWSPVEIADDLHISTNAASVRINRGVHELRNLLKCGSERYPMKEAV